MHAIALRADILDGVKVIVEELAVFPKAVASITAELEVLLAFYDFQGGLEATCAPPSVGSSFATVRLRIQGNRGRGLP